MAYRLTRLWSRFLGVCGLALIVASLIGAAALFFVEPGRLGLPAGATGGSTILRLALAVACAAVGFLFGASLMVAGQLLQFLLSAGVLLRRVDARMRAWEGKFTQLFEEQPAVRKRGRPGL